MTDKQIIIDGVDVSGCEFYDDGSCRECDMRVPFYSDIDCHDKCNKDCYYKQLKRKEQECEELKEEKQGLIKDWEEKKNLAYEIACKNEKLKAENDNLKSLIWWIHVGAEGADKATTEYYENRNTQYEENYWKRIRALQPPTYESKYKLALTEIKTDILDIREGISYFWVIDKCDEILQKISEVEYEKI